MILFSTILYHVFILFHCFSTISTIFSTQFPPFSTILYHLFTLFHSISTQLPLSFHPSLPTKTIHPLIVRFLNATP